MRKSAVHGVINDEKLFPRVLHEVLAYVANEILDIDWQALEIFCRNRDTMFVLVCKQHFQASTVDVVSQPAKRCQLLIRT
jgi:hypothetical protein